MLPRYQRQHVGKQRLSAAHDCSWNGSVSSQLEMSMRQGNVAAFVPVHRYIALQRLQRFRRIRKDYSQSTILFRRFGYLYPPATRDAALTTVVQACEYLLKARLGYIVTECQRT